MSHIETMKGSGTVSSNKGEQIAVRYELHVYQEEIDARTLLGGPARIPGMKTVQGVIQRCAFSGRTP
jgi:hypothetical protein